jgi:DNA-directed RNA polymerase specialized sigma subunit
MATKKQEVVDRFLKAAMPSGISDESAAKYKEYRGRRGAETKLWEKWHASGKETQHLSPLLKSMQPLIRSEADKRMQGLGGSIPRAAIESALTASAVKSFQTFSPERGAALQTHVVNGFQRVSDFINPRRNSAYMPSADVKKYQALQNVTNELRDQLGRLPTAEELAPHMPGTKVPALKRMMRGFGEELYTDMGDSVSTGDESVSMWTPRDAFHAVHSELTPLQRQFGSMYFAEAGTKQPGIKSIAKALGVPEHRAYRLKSDVETRMQRYLKGQ